MFAKRSYLDAGATGWLLALATLFAGTAAAQDAYVSNTEQAGTAGNTLTSTAHHAQKFTTGSESGGYTLGSIGLTFNQNESGTVNLTVTINSEDSDGNPGTVVYTLTKPGSLTSGTEELFFAPSNASLSADTSYFVTVEASGTYNSTLRITTSNAEDSGASTGWSINDKRHFRSGSTDDWGESSNANKLKISVYPPQTLPWDTTMTVGSSGNRLGYSTLSSYGSLEDNTFVHDATEYEVRILDVNASEARLRLGPNPGTSSGWVLEWAGEELPLDSATNSQTFGSNRVYTWDATWLTNNASSLDSSNYQTTVTSGSDLTVCMRLSTQTCSSESETSTDATLSDLQLSNTADNATITISPNFASDDTSYTASVANDISQILVLPFLSDNGASVEFFDENDMAITDAGPAVGWQIDLSVGDNTIKVKVTAEDTMTVETYTIVVTRSEPVAEELVSNTSKSNATASTDMHAQAFTTGSNVAGYTVAGVGVRLSTGSRSDIKVRIFPHGANGLPDESASASDIIELTDPATVVVNSVNTFSAPADTTLDANTTYVVVISDDSGTDGTDTNIWSTSSNAQDSDYGWTIGDSSYQRATSSDNWSSSSESVKMTVNGYANSAPTNATLSGLSLEDTLDNSSIALSPTFASGVTNYTVSVANGVSQILVDPTTADFGATVEFLDADDMAIDDAESMEDGHQIDLAEGENTIKVKVTAEDTMTVETYTVVVTRAAAVSVLVSNTEQTASSSFQSVGLDGGITKRMSQGFTTGDNPGGYTLDRVRIYISGISSGEAAKLSIYSDSSGDPDSLVHALDSPNSYSDAAFNNFNAPADATLAANTPYHVFFEATSGAFFIGLTQATAQDAAGEDDWMIANTKRRSESGGAWFSSTSPVRIRVFGTEDLASTDATLSDLGLQDTSDNSTITLTPTFATATTGYTAMVANGVSQILVDPTTNDDGATVEFLNAGDMDIDDADMTELGHQIALAEGANTIKVKVTAEDTTSEETYTVVVTRAEAATTTEVLVSNFGESDSAVLQGLGSFKYAQRFSTGTAGSTLEDVSIDIDTGTTDNFIVAIHEPDSVTPANPASSALYPLSTPAVSGSGRQVYTAPDSAELDGSANYFVVVSATENHALEGASSGNETGKAGWSIANTSRLMVGTSWSTQGTEMLIRLRGVVGTSTDATLSALDLSWDDSGTETDIALTPTFASAATSYTAMVANGVDQILVSPTTTDDGATVEFLDSDDNAITDAHADAGHQIDLTVGDNTIKVKVTAEDTMATQTYTVVVTRAAAANNAATGRPGVIDGEPYVGKTLTADKGNIADDDGVTKADNGDTGYAYRYQWTREDEGGGNKADITGATGSTYTLTMDDDGKRVRVRVSFRDDLDNDESLESRVLPRYGSVAPAVTPTTLSADALVLVSNPRTGGNSVSAGDSTGSRATQQFTVRAGTDYTLEEVTVCVGGNNLGVHAAIHTTSGNNPTGSRLYPLVRTSTAVTGAVTFAPPANAVLSGGTDYFVVVDGPHVRRLLCTTNSNAEDDVSLSGWSIADGLRGRIAGSGWQGNNRSLAIQLRGVSNASGNATGAPTITGTAAVDETLSAAKGTTADAEGLTKADNGDAGFTYSYQWIRVDGGTDTEITGATDSTYVLVDADEGKTIKVKASFYDDAGTRESVTSAATATIQPRASNDATLSDLDLSWNDSGTDTDIALTPTFATATLSYTAMVANGVDEILVDPTTTDDGATVEFLDNNDMAIADANAAAGHQVALAEGDNTIKVKVTAEDTTSEETYTLVVTRALEVSVLVSNTGRSHDDTSDIAGTSGGVTSRLAQGFTTGDNLGGYTLDRVRIAMDAITGSENAIVSIYSNSGDSPDSLLHTLVSPASYPSLNDFYEFDAPATATLDASTTYHIVIEASSGNFFVGFTAADGEDPAGEDDWSLADSRRRSDDGAAWASHDESLRVRVFGSERTPSTDATLSDLELHNAGDDSAIGAFPDFAPEVTSYSAWVRTDGAQITVTPSLNDDGATVEYLNANDLAIDDANTLKDGQQINLAEGFNTIKVKVTAEDTLTTETYAFLITRLAPILVHNLGQVGEDFTPTDTPAQAFTTGPNPGGYEIAQAWVNTQNQGTAFSASIWTTNANAEPDTLLYSLTAPDSFVGFAIFFGAPVDARLDPSTTYSLVLDTPASGLELRITRQNGESAESASGWSIRDTAHFESSGSWADDPHGDSLHIGLAGRELAASTDATLSDLALQDTSDDSAIALTPTFASDVTSYTVSVANDVDEILVDPTVNDSNATVAFLDAEDMAITDADGMEDGHQVALAVGANTIKVKVTAEDTTSVATYTVVVTRAAATDVLVSNFDENNDAAGQVGGASNRRLALKFTVGPDSSYTVTDIRLNHSSEASGVRVAIHEGSSTNPGTLLYDMDAPTSTSAGNRTHSAPSGAVLAASTSYFVVVRGDTSLSQRSISMTDSDNETGETGWSIADVRREHNGSSWSDGDDVPRMRIRGYESSSASTDATLSDLELQNTADDSDIALTPTFATATLSYTAMVANGVDEILVAPTTTDDGATVEFFDNNDTAIDDANTMDDGHQIALAEGDNTIKVKVTAEDTMAVETYEIVVTRAASMTASTLVSNTGQDNTGARAIGYTGVTQQAGAVKFATGANSGGYDLGEVELAISDFSGNTLTDAEPVVTVREPLAGNASNPSDTVLYTLTNPATLSVGTLSFTAPANATLKPNSNYFIVMENASTTLNARYGVSLTDADAEDNTGESDWSIANVGRFFTNSWAAATSNNTFRVAVRGESKTSIAATGQPVITGTAQVGKTLTAGLGTIDDDDGLPATFPDDYSFQWVRVDDDGMSNPVNIGTDDEYTLVGADVHKQIKVKVTFFDAGSAAEGPLESDAYPASGTVLSGATECSSFGTSDWCATLTVGDLGGLGAGYYLDQPNGALDDTEFDQGGTTYTVEEVRIFESNIVITLDKFVPRGTFFALDDTTLLADATSKQAHNGRESWPFPSGFAWLDGQEVTVRAGVPPQLQSAAVDGDTLVLTYNEAVTTGSPTPVSAYSVKVDGGAGAAPSGVEVSGSTVTLTLATAVTSGQTVTLSYTVPGNGRIQDETGAFALAFTDEAVTNNTSATNPASGSPSISGAPQVNEILTAGMGDIADADNLPSGTFPSGYTFQWIRVDSSDSSETNISGATSQTYTPVAEDVGHTLKVQATFTDGANNVETVTSAAYPSQGFPASVIGIVAAKSGCPGDAEWCEEMTTGFHASVTNTFESYGFDANEGQGIIGQGNIGDREFDQAGSVNRLNSAVLRDGILSGISDKIVVDFQKDIPQGSVFDFGGTELTVNAFTTVTTEGYEWSIPSGFGLVLDQKVTLSLNLVPLFTGATVDGDTLVLTYHEDLEITSTLPAASDFSVTVAGTAAALSDVAISGTEVTLTLATAVTAGQTVTVSYLPGANRIQDESGLEANSLTDEAVTNNTGVTNTAATGEPVITGAFQVGKTLTAGIGDITDDDGMPSTAFPTGYTFQWIRVDGGDGAETDISGETSQTYTPGTADVGNYLKVKVSFTDGGGISESRTGPAEGLFDLIVPAAVSNCDSNTVWCATLTSERTLDEVGDEEGIGFNTTSGFGSVSPVSFMHQGVQYTVIQLNTGGPDLGFATTPVLPSSGAGLTLHVQSFGGEIDLSLADDAVLNANDVWFFGGATDAPDPTPLSDISLLRFPSRNDSFQASTGHGAEIAVRLSAIPLLLTGAAVDGDTLVLSYDNTLDDTSTPALSDFSVTVDSGTPAAPSNVSISGSEVTLTLAAAVTAGQTVTVSYTSGTNPIQDESGIEAADLTDEAVTNDTVDAPTEIWSATLTVQGLGSGHRGCGNSSAGDECTDTTILTEDEFNYDSTDYDVTAVRVQSNGQLQIWFDPNLTGDATSMALIVDGETFRFEDADAKNANNRRWNNSGLILATNEDIELRLTEDPGSSDANLSGLYVEDYFEEEQIHFTPAFSSSVTNYTLGRVANYVRAITIRPTTSDGNATVAYFDASGQAIEDYDTNYPGHDIELDEGENVIEMEVTSEDGMTVKSYFLTVARVPSSLPAGVLVSNYWQLGVRGTNSLQVSQPFTTGSNPTGYDLTGVAVEVNTFDFARGALVRVAPAASNGEPDLSDPSRIVTLSNPATTSNGDLNVFTAPMGAKLAANTTYHVVATSANGMNSLGSVQATDSNAEDMGSVSGWSIGDGLYQRVSDTAAWQQNTFALSMQILAEFNTDITACPPGNDWCAEMTVGVFTADSGEKFIGYASSSTDPIGALDDPDFDFEGRTYNVRLLIIHDLVSQQDRIGIATDTDWPLGPQINFGGAEFVLEAYRFSRKDSLSWPLPAGMAWVEDQMVTVSVNFAPEIHDAKVDNATLELTFHEALDENSVPAPGAFSVKIDGGDPVAPASVAVSGDTVTLTLSPPAYKDQTATLSYEPPAANPLQDAYGVKVFAFTNRAVTNNTLNTAAAGAPGFSGAPQVGGTLRAERGSISDIDGLPSSFPGDYRFQWIRVDSSDVETDIAGATGRDYSPVNADVGNRLKVRVSFSDNGGAPESRTSEAHPSLGYPVGGLTVQPRPAACPDDSDWCAEMTVEARELPSVTTLGYLENGYGALDDTEFVLGGVTYEVEQIRIQVEQDSVRVELSRSPPAGTVFDIGGAQLEFASANLSATSGLVPAGFVIVDGQQMTVSMKAGNLLARGKPVVVGAAVVGQTLTASAGGIFDWNGTERAVAGDSGFAFEYQWLRVDSGNETPIAGATSDTYTLDSADVGKSIKAQVSFTDDLGNAEGPIGSEATAVVMAAGDNAVPVFDGGNTQTRGLDENIGESEDSAPREVGAAVSATDADNDTLTYSLGGADAAKFTIDPASGQLRTRSGERYDFERKPVYSLIVAVNDGTVELTANVTVRIVDLAEVPVTPSRILIRRVPGDPTALEVEWTLIGDDGRPEVQVYELRYRLAGQTSWPGALDARNRDARITGLTPGRLYELQVRAVNADGSSEWSEIARESTGQLPPPEISFGSASYTAIEGAAGATVEVEVFPPQNRALTIPLTVTEQDGATAADWSGVPANVTVEAGQASASFIVTAAADEDADDAESLLLGFGALPGNATAGDPAEARVALLSDTSVRTWYLFFEEAEYGVTEGDSVTVTVGLSNPWKPAENEALTIGLFAPEHQGGARKKDYSGVPESVTFQPGQTRVSFTITATDDSEDDDGESILLQFTRWNHDDLKTGRGPYPATVYLHDNDGDELVRASFGEQSYTVREGGFIDIEVELDRPPGRALTIPIEVSTRNGAGPNDYTIETLEAIFGASQTSQHIEIEAIDDNANDDLEYLELSFGELPDKVREGSPNTTIVNLEDADNGRINVTVRMAGGGEKHEGGGTFLYIYLNEVQEVDVLVPLVVEHLNGATEDDYSGVPATVTIPAGEIRDGVIIDVLEDSDDDDGEGIRVSFGDLPAGVKANPDRSAATYRFLDNDNVPQMTIQGDGAKEWPNPTSYLKFIVTLDYIPEFEVTVDYATEDGTAVANQDYKPTSGTLTFAPGEAGKTVWVEVCSDGIDEDTERMTLRLSNPVRAEFRNGATASATGTISDYRGIDAKPCSTGIVIEDAEGREFPPSLQVDQDNEMTFEVRLNRAARNPVTVSYRTVDGTATAGQDYDALSGVLRFELGETEKTITVTVKTDLHDDPGETFTMLLSNPQGAYLGDGEATGTIRNSGPMPGAWLSRFGRVAADQAVQSIGERIREGTRPRQDNQFTLGGRRVGTYFDSFMPRTGDDGAERRQGGASLLADDGFLADDSVQVGDGALTPDAGTADGSPADSSLAGGSLADSSLAGSSSSAGGSPVAGDTSISPGSPSAGRSASAGRSSRIAMPWDGLDAIPTDIDARPGMTSTSRTWQPPTLRELMMGASFDYSRALDENGEPRPSGWLGEWSSWGRTAATRFAGADGPLSINGEVVTATLGFDSQWDRWIGGVALSYSEGEGAYTHRSATGGAVSSSLTSLMPYASYTLNDRTSVWGTLGYGVGDLTLTPEGASAGIETDLSTALAAFGGRGVLNARVAGIRLAWVSDALLTETSSDTVQGLNGAAGGTSRVRLMLEGSGSVALGGVVLRPRVEAGLRYDGGDAETGAGIELGGGLGYAAGRIAVQINARGLVAHEDAAYEEWGFSGSVQYRPGKDGRGLTMQLGSAWGATQSGVQSLWARADASGLARTAGFQAAQRFQAELGYGLAGPKGRALWVPFLQGQSSGGAQALVLGVRMTSGANISAGLEIGGRAGAGAEIEPAVQLNGSVRW